MSTPSTFNFAFARRSSSGDVPGPRIRACCSVVDAASQTSPHRLGSRSAVLIRGLASRHKLRQVRVAVLNVIQNFLHQTPEAFHIFTNRRYTCTLSEYHLGEFRLLRTGRFLRRVEVGQGAVPQTLADNKTHCLRRDASVDNTLQLSESDGVNRSSFATCLWR